MPLPVAWPNIVPAQIPKYDDRADMRAQLSRQAKVADGNFDLLNNELVNLQNRIASLEATYNARAIVSVPTPFTIGAGFSLGTVMVYTFGVPKVAFLRLLVTRTGAAIVGNSFGDFADTTLGTLISSVRPTNPVVCWYHTPNSGGGALVQTNGVVQILDIHSTGSVAVNDSVQLDAFWPLPAP